MQMIHFCLNHKNSIGINPYGFCQYLTLYDKVSDIPGSLVVFWMKLIGQWLAKVLRWTISCNFNLQSNNVPLNAPSSFKINLGYLMTSSQKSDHSALEYLYKGSIFCREIFSYIGCQKQTLRDFQFITEIFEQKAFSLFHRAYFCFWRPPAPLLFHFHITSTVVELGFSPSLLKEVIRAGRFLPSIYIFGLK